MKSERSLRVLAATLMVIVTLASLYTYILRPFAISLRNIPTAGDAEQARNLTLYLTGRVHFDGKSVLEPDQPTVYWVPFRNSARIDVYSVTNAERQNEVVSVVRDWQTTNRNMAKLSVRFYERENWKSFTNEQAGYSGGQRLPEKLLREVFITLTNQQPKSVSAAP